MLRFTLREAGRLVSGLFGATLLALLVSSLSVPVAARGALAWEASALRHALSFMHFTFGANAVSGRPAIVELAQSLPHTLVILVSGAVLAIAIGSALGLLLGGLHIRLATAPLMQLIAAVPVFCAAIGVEYAATRWLGWNPTLAPATRGDFRHLLLPILIVGLVGAVDLQFLLRSAAQELAHKPFRLGLRRLGLSGSEIERAFVAPQLFAIVLEQAGEFLLALIGATAVAEWVFHVPGAGVLFIKSVALSDWDSAALVLLVCSVLTMTTACLARLGAHALSRTPSL